MSSKCILIIDDEESIQKVVKLSLKLEAGWESITASSGPEGIRQAEAHHPDAILLDVMMPETDGIKTFEFLRDIVKSGVCGRIRRPPERSLNQSFSQPEYHL